MSQKNEDNNSKSDIDGDEKDIEEIGISFVDSLFNKVLNKFKPQETLNQKAKDFYSQKPKQSNRDQLKNSFNKNPLPSSLSIQGIPKKVEINLKPKINSKTSNVEKPTSSKSKHKNESNEKIIKSKEKNNKMINTSNAPKEKKLNYNTSVKNISRTNKDINNNNTNIRDLSKRKQTHSSVSKNFKASKESEKEKKLYQEKVRLLENRILALKNHQDEIKRKMLCNDVRQTYLDQKKKEKSDMKQTLLSYDIDKRNELDLKRKQIRDQKNSLDKHLKESMEKQKITKMKDYQNLKKEKMLVLAKIYENNNQHEKYAKGNSNKIKKERELIKLNELKKQKTLGKKKDNYYYENCEDNKHETDNLKNKLKKLEKLEIKYINKLNKSRQIIFGNKLEGNILFKKEVITVQKLDLENQFVMRPFSSNDRAINKKNNNKFINISVDIQSKNNINENKNDNIKSNNINKENK
jgi:hypothetical protein